MDITSEKHTRSFGGGVHREGTGDDAYLFGHVSTPDGIVRVFSTRAAGIKGCGAYRPASSTYMLTRDGRMFHHREDTARTARSLTVIAGKFAKRVAGR